MAADSPAPVLVLGGLISALGALRSLALRGIRAHAVGDVAAYVRKSRHHRPLASSSCPASVEALTTMLEDLPLDRAVLMPASDHWVAAAARLNTSLSARFPSSAPDAAVLDVFLDKAKFLDALERFSISRPETIRVRSAADLQGCETSGGRKWFLKPVDSQRFKSRFGVKAMRVASRAEALARWETIREAGLEIVLQEYVPGGADRHFFVDGFIDRTGTVRAVFARRRIRMHPPDFGDSSYMTSIPREDAAAAIEGLIRLLLGVGHRGIFSAEFKRDPRDDVFRVIEVNVRPWAYVEFATRCGVNTPAMAHRDALGLDVASIDTYAAGMSQALFPQDFLACRKLAGDGRLRWTGAMGSWARASDAVFRWDDPLPGVFRLLEIAGRRVARTRQ